MMNKLSTALLFALILAGCGGQPEESAGPASGPREIAVIIESTGSEPGDCIPKVLPDYACPGNTPGAGPGDVCMNANKPLKWRLFGVTGNASFTVQFKPFEGGTAPDPFQSCGYKSGNKFNSSNRVIQCKIKKKSDLTSTEFEYGVEVSICNTVLDPRIFISDDF